MATNCKHRRVPWNKGKIGCKEAPLKLREIWAIRVRLQLRSNLRARDMKGKSESLLFRLVCGLRARFEDTCQPMPKPGVYCDAK
jgi:hypothetical protein